MNMTEEYTLDKPKKQNKSCKQNNSTNNIANRQKVFMNNYKKSPNINFDIVWDNMFREDEHTNEMIYKMITNPYQKKLNLINAILNSDSSFPINNTNDILKFFNWLNPLNVEYSLASFQWDTAIIRYGNKKKILLQNSIVKKDADEKFYSGYINLVKNILKNSNVEYYYFEFKSKRFNKIKDIIWAFDYIEK